MFKFLRRKTVVPEKMYSTEEYNTILADKAKIHIENEKLLKEIDNIRITCDTIALERDKLKTLVRDQTEADLLVNALKGLGIIPKPVKYDPFIEQRRLIANQQMAMAMDTRNYNYGALYGLGGLGSIFGR